MTKAIFKGKQLREFRKQVSRLKKLGLVSKKVDARSQKSTRHMRDLVEKRFAKVLSGQAIAVKVPNRKIAKRFSSGFDTKGKLVIVPNEKTNLKPPRYSKKTGKISATRFQFGKKITSHYEPINLDNPQAIPRGPNIRYSIPFGSGYHRDDNWQNFLAFMTKAERGEGSGNPYKNWRKYVTVEEVDNSDAE